MDYWFLEPARDELDEAVEFYNQRREGLGDEFEVEVKSTIRRILEHPQAWHPLSPRTRRGRTRRFPHAIIYQIRGDEILIVADVHLRRRPGYWKDRVRQP